MKFNECDGKRKYKSKAEAKKMLRAMGRYNIGSKEHHIYFCRFCKKYHIGEDTRAFRGPRKERSKKSCL